MSELLFVALRFGFLALLWVFIFAIVYALRSDLFGAPARKLRTSAPAKAAEQVFAVADPLPQNTPPAATQNPDLPSAGQTGPATKLLIVSGVADGTLITLDSDIVTIGRSPDSTLVIVDEYTSTHHARLNRAAHGWTLTDLDSTNGTKVDSHRITGTVELPIFTPVTIGKTTFELRP